ncbi:MAG: hypothetical protein NUV80_00045 [Candidatus Berkelbacteria bacterium]|nr:hypothetical protein [Candidatus Berkelbacteria bacterium]MCR4306942.1 hypothetical protein [Candidatus Berkelbacteria bacterium]
MLTTKLCAEFAGRYEPLVFERLKHVLGQEPYQPNNVGPFFCRTTQAGSTECLTAGHTEDRDHTAYIETRFYSHGLDVELRYWGAMYCPQLLHVTTGAVVMAETVAPERAQIEATLRSRFHNHGTDPRITDLLMLFDLLHPLGVRRVKLRLELVLAYDYHDPVSVEKRFCLPVRPEEGFVASREITEQMRMYLGFDGPLHKALTPAIRRTMRYFRETFEEFKEEWEIYFPDKDLRKFLHLH